MTAFVTGGAGFLLAVLWFDLMFDVQALRRRTGDLPEDVLASTAGYYRRGATAARPMNRLRAGGVLRAIVAVVVQLVHGDVPRWTAVGALVLSARAISLAPRPTGPGAG